MKIAILGSIIFNKAFQTCISKYKTKTENEYIVTAFLTDAEFCENTKYECEYDMVVISLDSHRVNSINALDHIRRNLYDEETAIVVASLEENGSLNLIKYRLYDFLKFPFDDKQVYECIDLFENGKGRERCLFTYRTGKAELKILSSEIVYLQNIDKKVLLYTNDDNEIYFSGKISDYQEQCCLNSFIKIHRSFLINPMYIKRFDNDEIVVTGGRTLPVSRNQLKNIKELML